jgi:hypothetical protein
MISTPTFVGRSWCALLCLAALAMVAPPQGQEPKTQDPQPARPAPPPADAPPLRPIEEPYVEPVQRGDLPERYGTRDPIEGVWQLRQRYVDGQPADTGTGYLFLGRRHLAIHLQAPGLEPDIPMIQSAVHQWERADNSGKIRTTTLVGHFNETDGDILIERAGQVQLRTLEIRDGLLRIAQGAGTWMDFAKIE